MVVIMLAGVMFPLWPIKLRLGVWYLSIAALCLIGAFMGLAVVRLVVWCVTVVGMKRAIWIFPNLFEDVGFVRYCSRSAGNSVSGEILTVWLGGLIYPDMGI